MRYVLGIDLGTGHTAAAVSRLVSGASDGYRWSEAEEVPLGPTSGGIPSVLYVQPDGTVRAGEADAEKGRPVRGFARRVGDDVPLIVDGEPYTGQSLMATLAIWVVDQVEAREGGPADRVVVCHPGSWSPYRIDLLHRALWRAGLDNVTLLAAPVAVAEAFAAESPIGAGTTLAVHDLDGGESAVVRRSAVGTFELLGCADGGAGGDFDGYPGGIEPLLEDALLDQVADQLRLRFDELDPTDPLVNAGIRGLREACAAARERLIADAEASIAVELPSVRTRVVLTRTGLEDLIRPLLSTATDALLRTVRSCKLTPTDVSAVVLAGGIARNPLVGKLMGAGLPVRLAIGDQPQLRATRGAALVAQQLAAHGRAGHPVPNHSAVSQGVVIRPGNLPVPLVGDEYRAADDREVDYFAEGFGADDDLQADLAEPPPRPPVRISPLDLPKRGSGRGTTGRGGPGFYVVLALIGIVTIGIAVFLTVTL